MYSAFSLSFFNYPYVWPNVQTKLLGILEPTHNLVLTKVSPYRPLEQGHFSYKYCTTCWSELREIEAFGKKRVVGLLLKTIFAQALLMLF